MGYIYKITNNCNQKVYIGQTKRPPEERWYEHIHNNTINSLIHDSIKKYGVESHSFEVLEQCDDDLLNQQEKYWIAYYNSFYNGYNLTEGGTLRSTSYRSRPVVQFNLKGDYICTYQSIADAARSLGNINLTSAITNCCLQKTTTVHRYLWKYQDDPRTGKELALAANQVSHHRNRAVDQFDLNGHFIKTFNTIREAQLAVGAKSISSIVNVCTGRAKIGYGYVWKYHDYND